MAPKRARPQAAGMGQFWHPRAPYECPIEIIKARHFIGGYEHMDPYVAATTTILGRSIV